MIEFYPVWSGLIWPLSSIRLWRKPFTVSRHTLLYRNEQRSLIGQFKNTLSDWSMIDSSQILIGCSTRKKKSDWLICIWLHWRPSLDNFDYLWGSAITEINFKYSAQRKRCRHWEIIKMLNEKNNFWYEKSQVFFNVFEMSATTNSRINKNKHKS